MDIHDAWHNDMIPYGVIQTKYQQQYTSDRPSAPAAAAAAAAASSSAAAAAAAVVDVPQPRRPTRILFSPPPPLGGIPSLRALRLVPALSGSLAYSIGSAAALEAPVAGRVDGPSPCSRLGDWPRCAFSMWSILILMIPRFHLFVLPRLCKATDVRQRMISYGKL